MFSRLSLSRFMSYLPLFSFGLQPTVPGSALSVSPLSAWSASLALPTTWPTMPSADFCPAVRPPYGISVAEAAQSRSPGVSSVAFRAQSPGLRSHPCGYGLRGKWPLVRRCALYRCLSIDPHVCYTLPSDSPRGDSPCVVATLHLHSGWVEDFHLQATEHAQHTTKPLAR